MQRHSGKRHAIVALLGAAGLVAGSGVAVGQMQPQSLPGADDSTIQVAVGHDDLATVEVDEAGADATEVTGTFENTSGGTLMCAALGESQVTSDAVTVTEAGLVDRSLDYVTGNLIAGGGGLGIPGLNPGSVDAMLASGSLGSLGLGDPAAAELEAIQEAQDDERLAGHYGTAGGFTVDAGESADWSATLAVPTSERTDFDAAALVTCSQGEQWYAFAGYEPDDDSDNDGGGSLSGSLDMGSLGS